MDRVIKRLGPDSIGVLTSRVVITDLSGGSSRTVTGLPAGVEANKVVGNPQGGPAYVEGFSPPGSPLGTSRNLYLVDTRTSVAREIFHDNVNFAYPASDGLTYQYSADLTRVLIAAAHFPEGLKASGNPANAQFPMQTEFSLFVSKSGSLTKLGSFDDLPLKANASGGLDPQGSIAHQLSPDGHLLFYTKFVGNDSDAFLWRLDSGERVDLGTKAAYGQFSPDGAFLALWTKTSGGSGWTLFVVDAHSGKATHALDTSSFYFPDLLFSNGRLFVNDRLGTPRVLYQCNQDGANCRQVLQSGYVGFQDVEGTHFALVAQLESQEDKTYNLFLLRKDTAELRRIAQLDCGASSCFDFWAFSVSPDGKKVAMVSGYRSVVIGSYGSVAPQDAPARLLVYDLEHPSAPPVEVAAHPAIFSPIWSPDGRYLAYSASSLNYGSLTKAMQSQPASVATGLYVTPADRESGSTVITQTQGFAAPLAWVDSAK